MILLHLTFLSHPSNLKKGFLMPRRVSYAFSFMPKRWLIVSRSHGWQIHTSVKTCWWCRRCDRQTALFIQLENYGNFPPLTLSMCGWFLLRWHFAHSLVPDGISVIMETKEEKAKWGRFDLLVLCSFQSRHFDLSNAGVTKHVNNGPCSMQVHRCVLICGH